VDDVGTIGTNDRADDFTAYQVQYQVLNHMRGFTGTSTGGRCLLSQGTSSSTTTRYQ